MEYQYSPFNPVVWGVFGGAMVLIYSVVALFRNKHPDYPGKQKS